MGLTHEDILPQGLTLGISSTEHIKQRNPFELNYYGQDVELLSTLGILENYDVSQKMP